MPDQATTFSEILIGWGCFIIIFGSIAGFVAFASWLARATFAAVVEGIKARNYRKKQAQRIMAHRQFVQANSNAYNRF